MIILLPLTPIRLSSLPRVQQREALQLLRQMIRQNFPDESDLSDEALLAKHADFDLRLLADGPAPEQ